MQAALQGANTLVFSKAEIAETTTIFNLETALDMQFEEITAAGTASTEGRGVRSTRSTITFVPKGKTPNGDCRLDYIEALENIDVIILPTYNLVDTDC